MSSIPPEPELSIDDAVDATSGPFDHNAFLKEFLPARDELLAFAIAMIPRRADAENLFQEASLVLWQKYEQGSYTTGTNFKAWARKIIYNKALNERTRKKYEIPWDNTVIDSVDQAFGRAFGSKDEPTSTRHDDDKLDRMKVGLEKCMKTLSETNRTIVKMHYYDGKPYAQIAQEMDRSEGGLKVILHRIRKVLADCVQRRLVGE